MIGLLARRLANLIEQTVLRGPVMALVFRPFVNALAKRRSTSRSLIRPDVLGPYPDPSIGSFPQLSEEDWRFLNERKALLKDPRIRRSEHFAHASSHALVNSLYAGLGTPRSESTDYDRIRIEAMVFQSFVRRYGSPAGQAMLDGLTKRRRISLNGLARAIYQRFYTEENFQLPCPVGPESHEDLLASRPIIDEGGVQNILVEPDLLKLVGKVRRKPASE